MTEELQNPLGDEILQTPPAAKSAAFAFAFWIVYVGIVFLVLEIFFRLPF